MAVNQNAGNAFPNRAPTRTAIANINSGYQTYSNIWQAFYATYNGTAVSQATFTQSATPVSTLLFGQDYPVQLVPTTTYVGVALPVVGGGGGAVTLPLNQMTESTEQQSDLTTASAFNPGLLTPTLTTYNRGQRIQGVSATNSVPVGGWAVNVTVTDSSWQDGNGTDLTPFLNLNAVFAGAVLDGQGVTYNGSGTGQTSSESIVLLETAYTLAMFNNNNIFSDAAGKNWEVVGLYKTQ